MQVTVKLKRLFFEKYELEPYNENSPELRIFLVKTAEDLSFNDIPEKRPFSSKNKESNSEKSNSNFKDDPYKTLKSTTFFSTSAFIPV